MSYQISDQTYLGKVVLKVNGLDHMVDFYNETIGLEVFNRDETSAQLGIAGQDQVLLELKALDNQAKKRTTTGLYHMAFLLPNRQDLGYVLKHFQQQNQALTGAADHGYSEAVYLYDPELNGIEIYADKDKSEWDYQADGKIEGVTEPLDLVALMQLAESGQQDKFPAGTTMGHVHLQVADLDHSREFFGQVLGMNLKSEFKGQALFYAAGDYHHHIGNNTWATEGKGAAEATDPGLDYFEIILPDLSGLMNHLDESAYPYKNISEDEIALSHPDGIDIHILQA